MAKKVSLINMKGGVGKSTIAVNLAWHFAMMFDKKVLVVDLDPQFNASQYLLGQDEYKRIVDNNIPTVWNVFEQFTRSPAQPEPQGLDPQSLIYKVRGSADRVHLIPSRLELAFSLRNPANKEDLLAKLLSEMERVYDAIILDCAPTESFLTMAAYLASDWILVPVKPEYLSTIGLPLLVNSMEEFLRHHKNHRLELAGIVFNACSDYEPEEVRSKTEVKKVASEKGWHVFRNEISYSRSYPKGAREGKPIFGTSYSRRTQCERFAAFAEEFIQRTGLWKHGAS